MKTIHRFLSAFFTVCLLFSAVCLPTGAADAVTFTSLNDTICDLNDATMPFYQNGTLFISADLLSGNTLGIYFSTLRGSNAAVLYRQRDTVTIDLPSKTAVFNGRIYSGSAAIRGGKIFVSASLLSTCFNFTVSSVKVERGTLVRICSNSLLSDAAFVDAAGPLMDQRYAQYERSHHTETSQSDPEPTPTPAEEPAADTSLYCTVCASGDNLDLVLQSLSSCQMHADILIAPEDIAANAASLRRALAAGNGIVLRLDGTDSEALTGQIESANASLRTVTGSCTRLLYVENTTAEALELLRDAGYCPITFHVMRTSFRASSLSEELLRRAENGTVRLLLDGGKSLPSSFSALLSALRKGNCTMRAVNEVNYAK